MSEVAIATAAALLVAVTIAVLLLVAYASADASLDRLHGKAARAGHEGDDPACSYWAGDRAGVDLRAKCSACRA